MTALVSGEHRIEAIRGLGADTVLTRVEEGIGRFELVADAVGGDVLVDAVRRLDPGGTLVAYEVAGGANPSPLAFHDFAPFARLVAFFIYASEDTFGDDLALLVRLVGEGKLDPQLGLVRDWSETAAAVDALRRRSVTGKVVLSVTGEAR